MNWFEWADWRFYRWRMTRRCGRYGHDHISEPERTLAGWYVRHCYTCGARFSQGRVIAGEAESGVRAGNSRPVVER